jgi:ElaB/YqjD/DUF883 family membrane-anchored ribosome-binding protein
MAKHTTKQTKQTRGTGSAAAAGLQELIKSAEGLLRDIKDQSGEAVEALREKVSATAASARGHLADLAPELSDVATATGQRAVAFARRDPWRAAALAALAYIVLSALIPSRHD